PPDRLASLIARLCKLFRAYSTFYVSLIAVAFQHQVGDAPDVDLRDHTGKLSGARLFTVNAPPDDQELQRLPFRCHTVQMARNGGSKNEYRPDEGKLKAARRQSQGKPGKVDRRRVEGGRRKARPACWQYSRAIWDCSRGSRAAGSGLRESLRKDLDQLLS